MQYTFLQVLEALLIVLVLVPKHCANLWHISIEDFWDSWFPPFLWHFLFIPTLLALSVPVVVWLLVFSKGVGVWPACVSSPIFLNVYLGRILLGILLPFTCSVEALWFGEFLDPVSYWLIEVMIGLLVYISHQLFISSFSFPISKKRLDKPPFIMLPSYIKPFGTMTPWKYGRVDVYLGDTMESLKLY